MKRRMQRTSIECIQVKVKNSMYPLSLLLFFLARFSFFFNKTTDIPFNRRMVKKESFSLLFENRCIMCVLRDRRRQDGDGRTDEEKNVHVWRVVLSYDSYLLTTEKTFLLFRRVSLVLSLFLSYLLACLCVCVFSFIFSCEREGEQALLACSRARLLLLSLSLYVSPPPITRLLLHIASSSHHHPCFLLFRCQIFCSQHFYT